MDLAYSCRLILREPRVIVSLAVGFNFGVHWRHWTRHKPYLLQRKGYYQIPDKGCTNTDRICFELFCVGLYLWANIYYSKNAEKVNTEACIHRVIQYSKKVGYHFTVSTLPTSRSYSLALLSEPVGL